MNSAKMIAQGGFVHVREFREHENYLYESTAAHHMFSKGPPFSTSCNYLQTKTISLSSTQTRFMSHGFVLFFESTRSISSFC